MNYGTANKHRLVKVSIGPNVHLYSEAHFLRELAPLGMTVRSFRALLRALRVPTIEVGNTRLIDHLSFSLALRAVLRIGEPDFLVPGSDSNRRRTPATMRRSTSRLDLANFKRNFTRVIAELLASRRCSTFRPSYSIVDAASEAARRMVLAGVHALPVEEQEAYSAQALRLVKIPDPFSDLPPGRPITESPSHAPDSPLPAPAEADPPPAPAHPPRKPRARPAPSRRSDRAQRPVPTARVGRPHG